MFSKFLGYYKVLVICVHVILGVSCQQESSQEFQVECDSQMAQTIKEHVVQGMGKNAVKKYLQSLKVNFSYHKHEDSMDSLLEQGKSEPKYAEEFIVLVDIPSNSALYKETEIFTIGFDKNEEVVEVSCKPIATGL